jgi:hypothetical protein
MRFGPDYVKLAYDSDPLRARVAHSSRGICCRNVHRDLRIDNSLHSVDESNALVPYARWRIDAGCLFLLAGA